MPITLPTFLPGQLALLRGCARDYDALSAFHYVAPRPATWADVWVVRYRSSAREEPGDERPVAVGVLSYPVPSSFGRETYFNRRHFSRRENLVFANQHIRTISRVIVHPQFRALGLSTLLVRTLCDACRTRYVEALASMGRAHPLFERAGMMLVRPTRRGKPLYYIFDRGPVMKSGTLTQGDSHV